MPEPPVPNEVQEFLRRPNPCVVATISATGALHTAATWYDWLDDATVMLNMAASRLRLKHMYGDPRVALTILDRDTWYRHVSLVGRVREIRADSNLEDIDRLSRRYTGEAYLDRARSSWTAIVEVVRWHGWQSRRGGPGSPWIAAE